MLASLGAARAAAVAAREAAEAHRRLVEAAQEAAHEAALRAVVEELVDSVASEETQNCCRGAASRRALKPPAPICFKTKCGARTRVRSQACA